MLWLGVNRHLMVLDRNDFSVFAVRLPPGEFLILSADN